MAKYWSATEAAFYDTDIISESSLPEDCVLITDAEYAELMSHQCGGCVIVNGADNRPVAMQQVCQPCTCITHEEAVATDTRLGHVKIGDGITVAGDGTISADIPAEMVGATASADGQSGIVPAPQAGDQTKYLNGAGEWVEISNATNDKTGLVRPDGTSITVNDGVISAAAPYVVGRGGDASLWYIVWSDGRIEQGGRLYIPGIGGATVTFPFPFASVIYDVQVTNCGLVDDPPGITGFTATTLSLDYLDSGIAAICQWYAMGY